MIDSEIFQIITTDERYLQTKNFMQHGRVSVYDHSISVAMTSLKIAKVLHIKVDKETIVKVALLHDYFLYDWHRKDGRPKMHGIRHAAIAAENARRDFGLTETEYKAIRAHMFPINLRLPVGRVAIILTIADKYCATKETISRYKHRHS